MLELRKIILFDDEKNLIVNALGEPLACLNGKHTDIEDGDFLARCWNFELSWPGVIEQLMTAHECINIDEDEIP